MRRAPDPPPPAPQSAPGRLGASVTGHRPRPVLPQGAGEGKRKERKRKRLSAAPPAPRRPLCARGMPSPAPHRGDAPSPPPGGRSRPPGEVTGGRGGLPVPAPPAGPVPALHPPGEPSPARGAPAPGAAAAPSPRCCGTGGAAGRRREGEEEGTEVPGEEGPPGVGGGDTTRCRFRRRRPLRAAPAAGPGAQMPSPRYCCYARKYERAIF